MMARNLPDRTFVNTAQPQRLWYTPNPRIHSAEAARRSVQVAKWVATGEGMEREPDETALFTALHVCAYRANQQLRQGRINEVRRQEWTRRWTLIRDFIVEKNLGLAYSMVLRCGSHKLHEDDLLSEAFYALSRAAERYDPWRGYRFSTYACNAIARAIMRRQREESVRRQRFLGPVEDYSFEKADASVSDPRMELCLERLRYTLDENLGDLTDLESKVLARRFPRGQSPRLTFKEIAEDVGLSKERVRQIQSIALAKLREALGQDPMLR